MVTLRGSQFGRRAGAIATVLAGLLFFVCAAPARALVAAQDVPSGAVPAAVNALRPMQGGAVSLERAIQIASEQHPGGRVVRAVTIEQDGRRVHEIRILLPPEEGGRVVTVHIDAGGGR